MNKNYHVSEYGLIRSEQEWDVDDNVKSLKQIYIPEDHFNSLYNFVLENQDDSDESESVFTVKTKNRRRQIKVKNHVGVVETKDGVQLEILPKIFYGINDFDKELNKTKQTFLKMLRYVKNSPFKSVSTAHISSKKEFPILEAFIHGYITETELLIKGGLYTQYLQVCENSDYLRGRLDITKNIRYNYLNKSKFYCLFDEYSKNININRIIKTTLKKLSSITRISANYRSINHLLSFFDQVDESKNIQLDLSRLNSMNKSLLRFKSIIEWSKVFLENKGFTNFGGESMNMSILFPMERVFEYYITYLFKKFSDGYSIKSQDKSYFLVEKHKMISKFRLKPDIVATSDDVDQLIIDTKWKLIDQFKDNNNYNIQQSDMYQLYAYGKKYTNNDNEPLLVLLYPMNPRFTDKLNEFIYEGDLRLEVIPFNFDNNAQDEIQKILSQMGKKEYGFA